MTMHARPNNRDRNPVNGTDALRSVLKDKQFWIEHQAKPYAQRGNEQIAQVDGQNPVLYPHAPM